MPQRSQVLDVADRDQLPFNNVALHVLRNVNDRKRFYLGW
jgi:hypothetical protein